VNKGARTVVSAARKGKGNNEEEGRLLWRKETLLKGLIGPIPNKMGLPIKRSSCKRIANKEQTHGGEPAQCPHLSSPHSKKLKNIYYREHPYSTRGRNKTPKTPPNRGQGEIKEKNLSRCLLPQTSALLPQTPGDQKKKNRTTTPVSNDGPPNPGKKAKGLRKWLLGGTLWAADGVQGGAGCKLLKTA